MPPLGTPWTALFSDVDGTLVHTADDVAAYGELSANGDGFRPRGQPDKEVQIMPLLPSSTGMQGYISKRTLELIASLRRGGTKVFLVSGARASTLLERLPYLPFADGIVVENGGRIFLPDTPSSPLTMAPLVEDVSWRERHTAAGPVADVKLPPGQRSGDLWELYRRLEAQGWACDAQRYTTDFRVKVSKSPGKTEADLQAVISALPASISSSFNLGSADFYPSTSGKHRAAEYLMEKFGLKSDHCVSMGDDDNDLQLATVVRHAYITAFTSPSVQAAVAAKPESFTVAREHGFLATEELLQAIGSDLSALRRVRFAGPSAGIFTSLSGPSSGILAGMFIVVLAAGVFRRLHSPRPMRHLA